MTDLTIWTVGHSTHAAEAFLALLQKHGIQQIADIRRIPKSRRHPQFTSEALDAFLGAHGLGYRHFPGLGGLRKPRPDSRNTGWRHESFRGYADHMQTAEFQAALEALLEFAQRPTAVMCAEAVWWQCHRQLLSDALLARDVPVRHILGPAEPKPHHLSEFARVDEHRVTYPGLL